MHIDFTKKLDLKTRAMDIGAQKINNSKLDIFGIVIASFQIKNKKERSQFFEETFFLADISMNIALRIFFLTLSNVEINF